jgi:hypothetical protein
MLAASSVLFVPALAFAQPSDADRATARALAAEGNDALGRQDFTTAEDRFRRADALVHAPTLVVDHARALAGLGRFADAYRRYDLVLREGVATTAPWAWKRALKDAEREIEALKPKLAWLIVRVQGPSTPEVTINGDSVAPTELGTTRAVNPGVNVVRVSGPGYLPKEITVELVAGKSSELDVELAKREVVPDQPVVLEPERAPVVAEPAPQEPPDRTLAYAAFGVGGAGLALGIVTGILALGARSDVQAKCPDLECHPADAAEKKRFEDDASRYHTLGTISGIGFGVGIAGALGGAALLLMNDGGKRQRSGRALHPYVGVDGAGVFGSF